MREVAQMSLEMKIEGYEHLSGKQQTELWQWWESVVFAKFGRSPSMAHTDNAKTFHKEYRIGLKEEE